MNNRGTLKSILKEGCWRENRCRHHVTFDDNLNEAYEPPALFIYDEEEDSEENEEIFLSTANHYLESLGEHVTLSPPEGYKDFFTDVHVGTDEYCHQKQQHRGVHFAIEEMTAPSPPESPPREPSPMDRKVSSALQQLFPDDGRRVQPPGRVFRPTLSTEELKRTQLQIALVSLLEGTENIHNRQQILLKDPWVPRKYDSSSICSDESLSTGSSSTDSCSRRTDDSDSFIPPKESSRCLSQQAVIKATVPTEEPYSIADIEEVLLMDELESFVQQDSSRIERLRKRYSISEEISADEYGFQRRPSVRGIRTRFSSTSEILHRLLQHPPVPCSSHLSWPHSNSSPLCHQPLCRYTPQTNPTYFPMATEARGVPEGASAPSVDSSSEKGVYYALNV